MIEGKNWTTAGLRSHVDGFKGSRLVVGGLSEKFD